MTAPPLESRVAYSICAAAPPTSPDPEGHPVVTTGADKVTSRGVPADGGATGWKQ